MTIQTDGAISKDPNSSTGQVITDPEISGGTATDLTLVTPALGTPASGVLDNCTHKNMVIGDGTTGRKLRISVITIHGLTDATQFTVEMGAPADGSFNSETLAVETMDKDAPTGTRFNTSATGDEIRCREATGVVVAVIALTEKYNDTTVAIKWTFDLSGNRLNIYAKNPTTGVAIDIASLNNGTTVLLHIAYITSN